ncbi:hypothetical protein ACIO7M_10665 [Streptomyces toxytricini]|uniref:Uncharacterized protein n=1 Tax=Streptomyces toxytricini TaxID=67369 RepID=A0ABW8EEA7_STRT5
MKGPSVPGAGRTLRTLPPGGPPPIYIRSTARSRTRIPAPNRRPAAPARPAVGFDLSEDSAHRPLQPPAVDPPLRLDCFAAAVPRNGPFTHVVVGAALG